MDNITYEIFTYLSLWFVGVWQLDNILARCIKPSAKYFVLHVIVNTITTLLSYEDMISFIIQPTPDITYYGKNSIIASSLIVSFHLHHCIVDKLDIETRIHHILGGIVTGSIPLIIPLGNMAGCTNFIMCGFPGGINYLCLVLYKYGKLSKLFEKYINRWLNLLIRMPGMMFILWSIYQHTYLHKLVLMDNKLLLTGSFISLINTIYYCNKTVGNYHVYVYKLSQNRELSKVPLLSSDKTLATHKNS